MAEPEIRHPDGRIDHPSVRTEKTDASFAWIAGILLGAAILAAIIHGVVLGFFHEYQGYESDVKKSPFPLAPGPSTTLPPAPRLEPIDRMEHLEGSNVHSRLETKEEALERYGETESADFVRIPVAQAMNYLDQHPLKARKQPAKPWREDGLVGGGESNSGRLFRGRPRWFER